MRNAIDWLVASLIIIFIIMYILGDIRSSKWRVISFDSITKFLMKLKRGWGMIFRFLFITSVGFIGYIWFNPQNLGDIPFSQLTLNLLFNNLFSLGIVIYCIIWFFNFPDDSFDEPYNKWANYSLIVYLILVYMDGKGLISLSDIINLRAKNWH